MVEREGAVASGMADRRRAAELAQVAQAHRAMALDEDFSFYGAAADAVGNPLIAQFLRFPGPFIIPRPLIRSRPHAPVARRAYLLGLLAEHARILEALEAGDPAAARGAMREHLERGLALDRVAPQRQGGPG